MKKKKFICVSICFITIVCGCSLNNVQGKNNSNSSYELEQIIFNIISSAEKLINNINKINTPSDEYCNISTEGLKQYIEDMSLNTDVLGRGSKEVSERQENEIPEYYVIARSHWDEDKEGYLDELLLMDYELKAQRIGENAYKELVKELKNVDYDGDGLKDRIYRFQLKKYSVGEGNESVDINNSEYNILYQIEFGNGITTTVTNIVEDINTRSTFFYSCDLDNDGQNEIIVYTATYTNEYPEGQISILKKHGDEYRYVPFPVSDKEGKQFFDGMEVRNELNSDNNVDCYVSAVDYGFQLDLSDYDNEDTVEGRTTLDAWLSEQSESENRKVNTDLKVEGMSFIKYHEKNAMSITLYLDIPSYITSPQREYFEMVILFNGEKISIEDFKKEKF